MTEPLPLLDCGEVDDPDRPESLDELLPELLEELLPESLEEPDELEPEELEPDELDPVDVELLLLAVTEAWLVPGRITATAPAATTLVAATAIVAAFSRRRPSSRSATA